MHGCEGGDQLTGEICWLWQGTPISARGVPSAACLGGASLGGSKIDGGGGWRMLGDTTLGGRWLGLAWARYIARIGRLVADGGGLWLLAGVSRCSEWSSLFSSSESLLSKSSLLDAGEVDPSESVLLASVWLAHLFWALVIAPAGVGIRWRIEAPWARPMLAR